MESIKEMKVLHLSMILVILIVSICENSLAFGLQDSVGIPTRLLNLTKLIPIVENDTMFKEITNGHGYLFVNGIYKIRPDESINNTITQGPIDMAYFLSSDKSGYYDKTLIITVNPRHDIIGYMEYPSYRVPTGYPWPAFTSLSHQEDYVPSKIDYNKLVIIMPPSPREQARNGVAPNDVECFHGIPTLELIFKAEDKSPACVKSNTADDLIERGWALHPTDESISVTAEKPITIRATNGTISTTLTLDIHMKNFQLLSPPLMVQVSYPNGTVYHTDTISMNSIPIDGQYKYTIVMSSNNSRDVLGKHGISVTHNGNMNQMWIDVT